MSSNRRPRIAALGLHHETNTFSSFATTLESFKSSGLQREGIQRGEKIAEMHREASTTFAGYFAAADRYDFDLVPLFFAATDPSGTIDRDAFDLLAGEMMFMLQDQGPWDGVLLNQMGAAVSDVFRDMDGEIAARTRAVVGPNVPIVMTLDLHANISQKMVTHTDALVVYRTNPHMDARERAVEACDLLLRTVRGEIRPVASLEMPPMVIGILCQDTREEPMLSVIRDVEDAARRPKILHASMGEGYPWADVPEMGAAFYAVADGDVQAAADAARWMAQRAWERRSDLATAPALSVRQAVYRAMKAATGPTVMLDVGDNIGAGSAGDSTLILAEARKLGAKGLVQTLRDPEAVARCVSAGVGAEITLEVGGKTDRRHGEPVNVTGVVKTISDGKFEDRSPVHAGWRYFDNGLCAVLETSDDHTLLLVSTRVGNMSRKQFNSVGIIPEEYRIVVAKGVVSPRPAYQPIAAEMLLVNTGGATSADLNSFNYRHRRRPLFPFETYARYP